MDVAGYFMACLAIPVTGSFTHLCDMNGKHTHENLLIISVGLAKKHYGGQSPLRLWKWLYFFKDCFMIPVIERFTHLCNMNGKHKNPINLLCCLRYIVVMREPGGDWQDYKTHRHNAHTHIQTKEAAAIRTFLLPCQQKHHHHHHLHCLLTSTHPTLTTPFPQH